MNKQITNKKGLKEPKSFSLVRGLQEGLGISGTHMFGLTVGLHAALALAEVQRPMQQPRINRPRVRLLL